jgi:hypothetical protein
MVLYAGLRAAYKVCRALVAKTRLTRYLGLASASSIIDPVCTPLSVLETQRISWGLQRPFPSTLAEATPDITETLVSTTPGVLISGHKKKATNPAAKNGCVLTEADLSVLPHHADIDNTAIECNSAITEVVQEPPVRGASFVVNSQGQHIDSSSDIDRSGDASAIEHPLLRRPTISDEIGHFPLSDAMSHDCSDAEHSWLELRDCLLDTEVLNVAIACAGPVIDYEVSVLAQVFHSVVYRVSITCEDYSTKDIVIKAIPINSSTDFMVNNEVAISEQLYRHQDASTFLAQPLKTLRHPCTQYIFMVCQFTSFFLS